MSHFGCLVVGENKFFSTTNIQYHVADRNGRIYLCGCMGAIRIGNKIKYCFFRSRMRTKTQKARGNY